MNKLAIRPGRAVVAPAFIAVLLAAALPAAASLRQGTIEFLTGRNRVDEPRFAAVYKNNGPIVGVSLSGNLVFNLNLYLDVKYMSRSGTLTYTKEETTLSFLPISGGLRYVLPLDYVHPYVGVGTDVFFYYEENPIDTVVNAARGTHLLIGAYVHPLENVPLALNLRLKWTSAKTTEQERSINLGGLEYGLAVAILF
ncbi:MAG: hypothetical protein OEW05_06380 [Candidatus Aminicenantes bacterium]|nr:hypothetical protein [Candidatus Aminicenantes bacterium]